ncbi:MAG: long-chain fatty acid--CoA ligase, partial [Alphaproteobacteria bacterium]|nr:long-chain fatty acid--CoA ligase [Alphaproteobacteria bacterium]
MSFATIYDAFQATAQRYPDNGFVAAPPLAGRAYHPGGIEYSYRQAAERIAQLRARFAAAGYGPGHRVALLLENRPEFFFHYLALNGLGAGIVPINPDYRHDEMLYQMEHSEADLVLTVAARRGQIEPVARDRAAAKPLPVAAIED